MPFVLGLNHRSAPLVLRERLTFPASDLTTTLKRLKEASASDEIVCLSTCNRTEVYVETANRHTARESLLSCLQQQAGREDLNDHLYYHENEGAVGHLFAVAAGLDSLVQGEHEILSQVKQAYQIAHQNGYTGKLLNVLFQRSLFVGKKVRTLTGLGSGADSVATVAVRLAERIFGDLRERIVMILGAGEMAETAAQSLVSRKAKSLIVANRTFERACEMAARFGGTAMHFDEGLHRLADVDIVICSTSAPHVVITSSQIEEVMNQRKGRSLFLIDIALPRDVDPAVNALDNVYLYNLDDFEQIVHENRSRRAKDIAEAEQIVQGETREFVRWLRAHRAGLHAGLKHHPVSLAQ